MRIAHAAILAGLTTAALSGAAVAASRDTHLLTVPLPDGSVARIEYVGKVAPTVKIEPAAPFAADFAVPLMPSFAHIDRMIAEMQRQADAMVRQADRMASQGKATATYANYGSMPAGSSSYTMVTTSDGSKSCTRTVEVTSQGAGKAPKVVSNSSGDCPAEKGAPAKAVPTA
jgi:hypothetical protein